MKILLTAFDPFGGESINPAEEAVKSVASPDGVELYKLTVPTVFGKSSETVIQEIDRIHPDVVVSIGQAGGRSGITPERVAINVDDAKIPDNEGNTPVNTPVAEGGPAAYFSTLPIYEITQELNRAGIPSSISNSAGTFVCNHLMYSVLHHAAKNHPKIRAGFIHVPFLPSQAAGKGETCPSMPLDTIVGGIEIVLKTVAEIK
ncbi:MAG: pyroglutamyl-peptidase I [Clostridia bacterium]|nr:pyroglutamyl-peptidase I [Clostridia bacterium]